MQTTEHQGKTLRYLTIEPDGYDSDRSYPMVILLHGFGSHMGDLAGLSPVIDSKNYLFVCPNAPLTIQIAPGMVGYAWTPIGDDLTPEYLQKAEDDLGTLIEEVTEQHRIEPGNAFLGGFSQGGMMTYQYGLPNPDLFGGLAALSARILYPDALRERLPEVRSQSVFMAHGTEDSLIPIDSAREARQFLKAEGYKPEYKEYKMAHEINQDAVNDLSSWVHGVLPPTPAE